MSGKNNVTGKYQAALASEFSVFDQLPAPVRQRLHVAVRAWSSDVINRRFRSEEQMLAAIEMADNNAVQRAADEYHRECGKEYPHVAARVTILR